MSTAVLSRYPDETVVKRKVVADRVLPILLSAFEVRELGLDVRIDFCQCCLAVGAVLYRHRYQRYI